MEGFLISTGWLLSVTTATGNGFVVILVAKQRRLHSSANWFVVSLAVADSAVGVILFPSGYFCNNIMACNKIVQMALFWFALFASVTNLCALTWDRFIAVVYPFKYNTSMTARRPGIVVSMTWVIPFTIALALFVGMYVTDSKTVLKVLRLTGVSAFDITCVLVSYAVVRILVVARAQSQQSSAIELQLQRSPSSMAREERVVTGRRKKHHTARFVIALVLFFLGCHVVANCLVMCITFSCNASNRAGQVITLLFVMNTAMNPFVYAVLKKDIKREIYNLICKENIHQNNLDER